MMFAGSDIMVGFAAEEYSLVADTFERQTIVALRDALLRM